MKKNFFKKLSVVLALALTVSAIAPAATEASAAAAPAFKSKSATVNVGQTKNYGMNNVTAYSVVRFVTGNKKIATVKKSGKTARVTGTAEGKTTLRADLKAYKSKKELQVRMPVTVKEDVVKMTGVSQKSLNTVTAAFSKDASQTVTVDNLTVANKTFSNAAWKIKSISFSDDGKKADVECYVNFSKDSSFTVAFDNDSYDFVAKAGDVAVIAVENTNNQVVTNADLTGDANLIVKAYDADGIDVTTDSVLKATEIEYSGAGFVDNAANGSGSKKILVMYNVGDTTTVTPIYHTGTYVDGVENVVKGSPVVIKAVDKIIPTVTGFAAYTISNGTPSFVEKDIYKKISTSDVGQGYKLYAKIKDTDNKEYDSFNRLDLFTFEATTDNSVLIVSSDGTLTPVKAGTAYVKATYKSEDEKTSYTGLLEVTVYGDRTLTTIKLDNTTITASDVVGLASPTIKVTGYDQLGDKININDTADTGRTGGPTGGDVTVIDSGSGTPEVVYTFDVAGKAIGTHNFKLGVQDAGGTKRVATVSVTVKRGTDVTNSYRVSSSATTMDMVIDKDSTASANVMDGKSVTIELKAFDSNSVQAVAANTAVTKVAIDAPGTDYDQTFTNDGSGSFGAAASNAAVTYAQGVFKIKIDTVTETAGSAAKLPTGTYKVTVTDMNGRTYIASFTVTDTQAVPAYKLQTTNVTSTADVDDVVKKMYTFEGSDNNDSKITVAEFRYNGTKYTSGTTSVNGNTGTYSITKINYVQTIGNWSVTHTITVSQDVRVSN